MCPSMFSKYIWELELEHAIAVFQGTCFNKGIKMTWINIDDWFMNGSFQREISKKNFCELF